VTYGKFKLFAFIAFLTQAASGVGPVLSDELPFSVAQMGVCDYAADTSPVSKSLRSLYACRHKVIIITNATTNTMVFDDVVINQNKCKDHLFLDGASGGPLEAGGRIVVVTSCKVSRIDFKINDDAYFHQF